MNDIFDFRRFGTYFAADFKRILHTYWPAIAILSLLGIMVYLLILSWNLIFFQEGIYMEPTVRLSIFFVASFVLCIYIPSRCYGHVTDRRKGAAFVMLPSSTLEKVLSMAVNCLIVIPAVFLFIYLGSDSLLCLADNRCGENLLTYKFLNLSARNPDIPRYYAPLNMLYSQVSATLVFLLGALCFRRHKVSKTMLVALGCLIVISMSSSAIFLRSIEWETYDVQWLLMAQSIMSSILIAGLIAAIYFRVKTIKH